MTVATGGTVTSVAGTVLHEFTANGDLVVTQPGDVEVLVVASGQTGFGAPSSSGDGGGAGGGVWKGTMHLAAGTYPVVVGQANNGMGQRGGDSSFNGQTVTCGTASGHGDGPPPVGTYSAINGILVEYGHGGGAVMQTGQKPSWYEYEKTPGVMVPTPGRGGVYQPNWWWGYGVSGVVYIRYPDPAAPPAGNLGTGPGIYVKDAGAWAKVFPPFTPPVPTGGTVTEITVGGKHYRVHQFDASGTFDIPETIQNADVLLVGGGGFGGGNGRGGGGGGEVRQVHGVTLYPGSYPIVVGQAVMTPGNDGIDPAGHTKAFGTTAFVGFAGGDPAGGSKWQPGAPFGGGNGASGVQSDITGTMVAYAPGGAGTGNSGGTVIGGGGNGTSPGHAETPGMHGVVIVRYEIP